MLYREEILYKYYEFNYHETAVSDSNSCISLWHHMMLLCCCCCCCRGQASLVFYELACKLNRDCNDLVWLAITGLTEQLLHEKIDR